MTKMDELRRELEQLDIHDLRALLWYARWLRLKCQVKRILHIPNRPAPSPAPEPAPQIGMSQIESGLRSLRRLSRWRVVMSWRFLLWRQRLRHLRDWLTVGYTVFMMQRALERGGAGYLLR